MEWRRRGPLGKRAFITVMQAAKPRKLDLNWAFLESFFHGENQASK